MSYEDILYAKHDGIARITINRPEVRNAFRPRTVDEMSRAFHDARHDPDIGVVILTGAGDDAEGRAGRRGGGAGRERAELGVALAGDVGDGKT